MVVEGLEGALRYQKAVVQTMLACRILEKNALFWIASLDLGAKEEL